MAHFKGVCPLVLISKYLYFFLFHVPSSFHRFNKRTKAVFRQNIYLQNCQSYSEDLNNDSFLNNYNNLRFIHSIPSNPIHLSTITLNTSSYCVQQDCAVYRHLLQASCHKILFFFFCFVFVSSFHYAFQAYNLRLLNYLVFWSNIFYLLPLHLILCNNTKNKMKKQQKEWIYQQIMSHTYETSTKVLKTPVRRTYVCMYLYAEFANFRQR